MDCCCRVIETREEETRPACQVEGGTAVRTTTKTTITCTCVVYIIYMFELSKLSLLLLYCCLTLTLVKHLLSIIESGYTKVLETYEDPKHQMKSKFVREILRFPA